MSLMAKTTLFYLIVTLIVFSISGNVTYNMVKEEVARETDYYLVSTFHRIREAIKEGKPAEAFTNDRIQICQLPDGNYQDTSYHFSDTLGTHPIMDRLENFRRMTTIRQINGQYYRVSMMDVLIESDDMYEGVFNVLSRLFLLLLLALILVNFVISRYLFRPFWHTLSQIKLFSLKEEPNIALSKTSTREFKQLNSFVEKMTRKARNDYLTLKEFSENASHEMQTPIAVAKGKLELLIQNEHLDEKQLILIQSAHDSIGKISRIGQSLTLLNKIENEEFVGFDPINFSAVLMRVIDQFEELAQLKSIKIEHHIEDKVHLKIHQALAEILISNLIKNAIQHNVLKGAINVSLTSNALIVKNSGNPPSGPTSQLFQRFKKGNQSGGSLGLGLSIVKKICDVSHWQINYEFENNQHLIKIDFT